MVALPNLSDDERVIDAEDARIRILICRDCGTIDPLPWYDGPAEHDDTLMYRLKDHKTPGGTAHRGNLATVSEKSWNDHAKREQIIGEISKAAAGGDIGLGMKMYEARATFQDDALTCWAKHNRPEFCDEYKADNKRLLADTREERRELGLSTKQKDRPAGTHLCNFCPVHSNVMQKVRKQQGYY